LAGVENQLFILQKVEERMEMLVKSALASPPDPLAVLGLASEAESVPAPMTDAEPQEPKPNRGMGETQPEDDLASDGGTGWLNRKAELRLGPE